MQPRGMTRNRVCLGRHQKEKKRKKNHIVSQFKANQRAAGILMKAKVVVTKTGCANTRVYLGVTSNSYALVLVFGF